jgi:hypothetical protein
MAEEKHHGSSGLFIPACLFLGLGIGLAFGQAGVGVLIGLGVGFVAMSFVKIKSEPTEVTLPSSTAGYFLVLLGLALVVTGIGLIFFPTALYPYIVGVFIALFGIGFIFVGSKAAGQK